MTRYQQQHKVTVTVDPPEPGKIAGLLLGVCQCAICGGMVGKVHDGQGVTPWLKEQGWKRQTIDLPLDDPENEKVWVCPVCVNLAERAKGASKAK